MPFPLDYVVDLFIGTQFVNVSSYVRAAPKIEIQRGRTGELSSVTPGTASFTLANADGRFANRNPLSPYYGQIGRNTPCRIAVQPHWTAGNYRDGADAFGRTAASGWGTADAGGAWTTNIGSGSVLASDWSVGSGVGAMAIAVANANRRSRLASILCEDADVFVTIRAPQATGAALEAGVSMREVSGTYVLMKAVLNTDNSVTATVVNRSGGGTSSATVAGLTHTGTGQPLRIRARTCGQYLMMKIWIAANAEPADWQVTYKDTGDLTGPAAGSPGLYAAALTGNSNAKPVSVTFDDLDVDVEVAELFGEVVAWPQKWYGTGIDAWAPIQVTGIMRRLNQGAKTLRSPLRRRIESIAPAGLNGLREYWSGEDASGSTSVASAIGNSSLTVFGNSPASFGSGGPDGSDGAIKFADGTGLLGTVNGFITSTSFTVVAVVKMSDPPAGNTQIINLTMTAADSSHRYWVFTLFPTGGTDQLGLEIFDDTGVNRTVLSQANWTINGFNERYGIEQVIWLSGRQNGANVEYEWRVFDRVIGASFSMGTSGSYAGTMGYGGFMQIPSNYDHIDWEYSHIAFWDDDLDASWGTGAFPDVVTAARGHVGETAAARFVRLCTEENVPYVAPSAAELTDTTTMGVQGVHKLLDLVNECAAADQGVICEVRQSLGLRFRTAFSLYNQTPIALDYTAGHLFNELPDPSEDDQYVHNDVTVTRQSGSSFRAVEEDGPLSVQDPPNGVGVYDRGAVSVNVESDGQTRYIAGWIRHLGTWDAPRWRNVSMDMNQPVYVADPTLASQLMLLDTGSVISLTNTPVWVPPGPANMMVQGYTKSLDTFGWRVSLDTTPADPWTISEFDDATTAKFETSGTFVKAAQASGSTSFDVYTYDPDRSANDTPLWTEVDAQDGFYWSIGGEKIRVDDLTHTNIAFRSVGTVAHANNASVTPGAPAGRAAGDLLLLMAAIRSTAATVTTPAGYSMLFNGSNFRIFGRIATNTAADLPTVSFAGGAAGDDTSGRIAAFSGKYSTVDFLKVAETNSTNGSAQDINFAGVMPRWDNCLIIWAGWKQDDWTSVATVTGATAEISEDSTITGNDQGFVWDYLVQTTKTLVNGGSFVVTGGASAVSKSAVLVIRSDTQTATVTRAQNSVVKAIAANAGVTLWTPGRFAL